MNIIDLEKLMIVEEIEHIKIYQQSHNSYLIVSDKSPMFCFESATPEDAKTSALKSYIAYTHLMADW